MEFLRIVINAIKVEVPQIEGAEILGRRTNKKFEYPRDFESLSEFAGKADEHQMFPLTYFPAASLGVKSSDQVCVIGRSGENYVMTIYNPDLGDPVYLIDKVKINNLGFQESNFIWKTREQLAQDYNG